MVVLSLENGDRLTRPEFERRYQAMPQLNKAELIEGIVYVPSPVRSTSHAKPHGLIITWLGVYSAATLGVELNDNATVRLDMDNEPQPDALLRLDERLGGQSRLSTDDYIEGGPELIVEIAASSAAYDVHDKLRAYRRNQVQEYLVWQVHEHRLDWWQLQEGAYVSLQADASGIVRSVVFPGLWLATSALIEGNLAEVLAMLQAGLAAPEHQAFVEQVRARQV
ncbi:MAG: Uma2 family endonuclease [Candidatus Tectomicrobia bacterium]